MNISMRGREVRNPAAKVLIAIGFLTIGIPSIIITLPISIPIHFALKKVGRRGFFRERKVVFDLTSFQKV